MNAARVESQPIGAAGLPLLDESWTSALAVAAHPDDLEYGSAAAVARWTSQGKTVRYCLATSGEAGIDAMPPESARPLREREQRDSAAAVGVDSVDFLGHPDGMLEYGLPLRRDIARAIRRHRPEIVITCNFQDRWAHGAPNQADHVAAGRAVVDAVRDAGNRWVFPELAADEHLPPFGGVKAVLVAGSPDATHGVDVTRHFDAGLESLRAHATYLAHLGDGPLGEPAEFLESVGRRAGRRIGCRLGTLFESIPLA